MNVYIVGNKDLKNRKINIGEKSDGFFILCKKTIIKDVIYGTRKEIFRLRHRV